MQSKVLSPFLVVALFCLTLAAWTGVLLRFGMIYGMPAWAQNFTAVRHAHSHLMYFGWVTLALMVLIWRALPLYTGRPAPRAANWQLAATAIAALLSFPAFWTNGYGLTQVGQARLPLGSMVSTLNGLTWFWFVGLYIRETRRLPERSLPMQLLDWAIMLMLLAAGGAAGLVFLVVTKSENPFLQQMFLHQFLDLFAVGWFTLAGLGVAWAAVEARGARLPRWLPTMSLALLLAPTFVLGMAPPVVPGWLFWLAAVANACAAVLLAVHLVRLVQAITGAASGQPALLWLALGSLGVTIAAAGVLLVPGVWGALAAGQMRIFYLHDLLLGWISTLLVVLLHPDLQAMPRSLLRLAHGLWGVGVAIMLAALLALGLAGVLPIPALWMLHLAAWASVLVAAAALILLVCAAAAWLGYPNRKHESPANYQPAGASSTSA